LWFVGCGVFLLDGDVLRLASVLVAGSAVVVVGVVVAEGDDCL
jgi:hypothetical protein